MKSTATTEQMEALRAYAAANGRTWKSSLRAAWMAGGYDDRTGRYIDGALMAIRNTLGPSWLARVRLK